MKKILLIFLFIFSVSAFSETMEGTILKVLSSEKIIFLSKGKTYTVRLYGVKAFNQNIRLNEFSNFAAKKMHGKKAWIHVKDKNRKYILGRVQIKSYNNLSKYFIENGYAMWDRISAKDNKYFKKLEQKAKDMKKGFWLKIKR